MANNYYDMTGILILDKVTPVIEALFGAFNLDANHPGNGQAYIADISEDNDTSWDCVLDGLHNLVEQLGLSLPADAADDIEQHLHVLASHFSANNDEVLGNLIEHNDFEDDADLDTLFAIGLRFDDGHGLTAYKVEAAWHCSKPRLFEFGGIGEYCGRHVLVGNSSTQIVALGDDLEAALTANDLDQCAEHIRREVDRILAGFVDDGARQTVRAKLGYLLSAPKTRDFAITGQIPEKDETEIRNSSCNRNEALQFVAHVANLGIWDHDKSDGTPYLECDKPSWGYIESHGCLMNIIVQARNIHQKGIKQASAIQPTTPAWEAVHHFDGTGTLKFNGSTVVAFQKFSPNANITLAPQGVEFIVKACNAHDQVVAALAVVKGDQPIVDRG